MGIFQKLYRKKDASRDATVADADPADAKGADKAVDGSGNEDDTALSNQLQGLRGELKSKLPEPEQFLSFDQALADREGGAEDDETAPGKFPNSPRVLVRYGAIVTIATLVIVAALVVFLRADVPNVIGQTAVEASEAIAEAGLNVEIFEEETPDVPDGQVMTTAPGPGEVTMRGTTVVIRVARNTNEVAVPNVRGKTLTDARETLTSTRLNTQVKRTFDNSVPEGTVVGFLPVTGTLVPPGSSVTLLVSAGTLDTAIEVPRVIGLTEDAARSALEQMGFNPVFYHAYSSRGEVDYVVAQTPGGANTVAPGSPVLVMISMGNSTSGLAVPDITEQDRASASRAIESSGFLPEGFGIIDDNVAAGAVISQMPPAQDSFLRRDESLGFLFSVGGQTHAEVPRLLGLSQAEAFRIIRDAGFMPVLSASDAAIHADSSQEYLNLEGNVITQQFPAAGSQYQIGLPVLMYLSAQD